MGISLHFGRDGCGISGAGTSATVLFAVLLSVACITLRAGETLAGTTKRDNNTIVLNPEGMIFRRISPRECGTNSPDFFLLETEVTNEQYNRYLKLTGRVKGDSELAAAQRARNRKKRNSGSVNSASPVYDLSNPALLWANNAPPPGRDDNPVALITIGDARAFCDWLTSSYPHLGLFRLPTVREWLVAAYGVNRKYPWGDEWSFDIPCVSSSRENQRTVTEPVKAHGRDRTPEGIYGLWGNVAEYVTDPEHFPNDTRWMGPSFKRYPMEGEGMFPFVPRNEWWGYVHNSASRQEDIGFRVLLEPLRAHDDKRAANPSQPVRSDTNSPSAAGGSTR